MLLGDLSMVFMLLFLVVGLMIGAFIVLYTQRKKGKSAAKELEEYNRQSEEEKHKAEAAENTKKVRDFMEFSTVEDDMIVQDDGKRYCMVVRCMGVNFDLMSEDERLGVEDNFAEFLSALNYPIQLYVQSRTVDYSEGIDVFREHIEALREDTEKYMVAVSRAKNTNPDISQVQRQQMEYEVKKKRNMLDYGSDLLNIYEKICTSESSQQRTYYVVVSCDAKDVGLLDNSPASMIKDAAYSELFTRCRNIQKAVAKCGVESFILKTENLVELLYIAYNKNDKGVAKVRDSVRSGLYRLYSKSTSELENTKAMLNAKMEAKEQEELAKKAMSASAISINDNGLTEEEQFEDDVKREAMQIIIDNQDNFDPVVVDNALEELNAGMHQPVVSEHELEEAANVDDDYEDNSVPIYDGTAPINPNDFIRDIIK